MVATIGTANAGIPTIANIGFAVAESHATPVVLRLCSTTTCPAKNRIKAEKGGIRVRQHAANYNACVREQRNFKRQVRQLRKSMRHARKNRRTFKRHVRQLRKSLSQHCNIPNHPKTVEVKLRLTHEERVLVQRGLNAMSHEAGVNDGIFGPRTRSAIRRYQSATRSAKTGYLTKKQARALIEEGKAREAATPWT